ncbi:hypothetical protein JYU34_001928 [Plutella xylostella]|uniref:Uncharacterized protein n=1 Tax=Plutella xylostella TaxID=51655 RepID=A0ABQ7R548_PLUXY|nr:hypothetical protein JYU34_001928 [Plutella xylostella]
MVVKKKSRDGDCLLELLALLCDQKPPRTIRDEQWICERKHTDSERAKTITRKQLPASCPINSLLCDYKKTNTVKKKHLKCSQTSGSND